MKTVHLQSLNDFSEWRAVARLLLLEAVPPDEIIWVDPRAPHDLFGPEESVELVTKRKVGTVPQRFIDWAEVGICYADPERFALLYRLLWRLQKNKRLMEARDDPDVSRLDRRVQAVRKEVASLKEAVQFTGEEAVAWVEPRHYVLERVAPLLARKTGARPWTIVTPYRSVIWDGRALSFGPGRRREELRNLAGAGAVSLPLNEEGEDEAMVERHVEVAPAKRMRGAEIAETPAEETFGSLAEVKEAVDACRRCPLYEMATQAVFGEGPQEAEIMFVGEQPGDQEDLAGKPFVGPAGKVFDAAMAEAGLDRERSYVTNAVKHFKFVPRGKKRLHQRPNAGEVKACRFWLGLEREFVKPKVIVAMGATAVSSLAGSGTTLGSVRGRVTMLEDGTRMYATVHPSYLLQMPDREEAAREREKFVEDLRAIKKLMGH